MEYNKRREYVIWNILYEDSSLYKAHGYVIQSPRRIYVYICGFVEARYWDAYFSDL
jgi:hypothetical protein